MKRKVVFLINSIKLGGAERALANLLSKPKFFEELDVSILLLDDEPLEREMPSHIPLKSLNSDGSLIKSVNELYTFVKHSKPDLVVSLSLIHI